VLNLLSAYNLLERIGREHRHPADTERQLAQSLERWSAAKLGRSARSSVVLRALLPEKLRQNSQFCSKKSDNPQQARYQRVEEGDTSGKTARYHTCASQDPSKC